MSAIIVIKVRYLKNPVLEDLKSKMVILSGPRQCGKTTFAKALMTDYPNSTYLNWDFIKDRKKIQSLDWNEDVDLLTFDEIHKKKNWKTFLKGVFDTKSNQTQILVTGSARLEFFRKSGDSMFGRYHSWRLHPYCMGEDPLHLSKEERWKRLLQNGNFPFPYHSNNSDDIQRWRNQRWSLLLREDLRDLESIKDLKSLELLAELLKNYAGGLLSYSNLAEDVEISAKTAKRWVQVLEKLYLIHLLSPYSGSIKRVLSKTPKVYFIDSGDLSEQSIGVQVENLVMLNILKRIQYLEDAHGERLSLHYIRDKNGREVDFVIALRGKAIALIEVKNTDSEPSSALTYFKSKLGVDFAIQLHTDSNRKSYLKKGVRVVSAQEFFDRPVSNKEFWKV